MKKTIIISPGRCGTQLLQKTIKENYQCSVVEEPFNKTHELYEDIPQVEFMEKILDRFDFIKLLYYQIDSDDTLEYLKTRDDVQFMGLTRKNVLANFVSTQVAKQTKKWRTELNEPTNYNNPMFPVTFDDLFGFYSWLKQTEAHISSFIALDKFYYEDMCYRWDSEIHKILEYLDLEPKGLYQRYKKTIRQPMSMIVSNFEELFNQCINTPLEESIRLSRFDFTHDWFSNNIPTFRQQLRRLKGKPLHFLEIGSYEGRSAVWLMQNILTHENSKLTCVEPGYSADIQILKQNLISGGFYPRKIKIIERESSCLREKEFQYDFIYIDGEHSAKQTLEDGINAFRLCKHGGIIAFDDYLWEEGHIYNTDKSSPKTGIDAFLSCYEPYIEVLHKEYQVWVRKK